MSESSETMKNHNNIIIMVIVGIVVLLLLCVCCFIPFISVTLLGSIIPGSSYNGTPQTSPAEPNTPVREEYLREYYVGDIVESDNSSFIVQEYEDPFYTTDGGPLLQDEKLVAVYIELTNTSQFGAYFSIYDWIMKDENDRSYYSQTFENYKEPLFKSQTLQPGETTNGWITFGVPEDAVSLSVGPNSINGYPKVLLY